MSQPGRITRRDCLRGLGASLALPLLGSWPGAARGAEPAAPLRLLFVFLPNGMHMPAWTPKATGADYELPPTLAPLAPHRRSLLVLSGLALRGGYALGDGPGDHARAAASFLTGAHPRKTGGADIKAGVSVDQVAASLLGRGLRFPSLELGLERSRLSGSCDSGYSCAYSSNISWRSPSGPNAKEIVPGRAFDRLFRGADAGLSKQERARRARLRASVLDAVLEDARDLRRRLGSTDRRKLEEYMDSVRAVEQRLEKTAAQAPAKGERFGAIPKKLEDHIDLMYDVIRLAFQTDSSRVVTFMAGNAGSNRSYPFIGVKEGHHRLSHHGRDPEKQAKIARINRFHVERFARFLEELKKVKEGPGTLLDNTLIVFASAIGDGNRHNHNELPVLLAGGGRGAVKPGAHLRFERDTPLCELYLFMLRQAGYRGSKFGDALKPLTGLDEARKTSAPF